MNLHLLETKLGACTPIVACVKHHGWSLHEIVLPAIHSVNAEPCINFPYTSMDK